METLTKEMVRKFRKWFFDYVERFLTGSDDLRKNALLKQGHTNRVSREIVELGRELGLEDRELCLAEIAALFHDIGRFEQYAEYQTFVDVDSVDHALLGVEILQREKALIPLDDEARDMILRVVSYHNRASLPGEESKECLFFTRLLRDADKLDIWRVVLEYYHRSNPERNHVIEYGLPDLPEISDEVCDDLKKGRIVSIHHLKTLNDFKLLQLGWIYDINFIPTFRRVRERKYLERIREVLPPMERIDEIFAQVEQYMDQRMKKGSLHDGKHRPSPPQKETK